MWTLASAAGAVRTEKRRPCSERRSGSALQAPRSTGKRWGEERQKELLVGADPSPSTLCHPHIGRYPSCFFWLVLQSPAVCRYCAIGIEDRSAASGPEEGRRGFFQHSGLEWRRGREGKRKGDREGGDGERERGRVTERAECEEGAYLDMITEMIDTRHDHRFGHTFPYPPAEDNETMVHQCGKCSLGFRLRGSICVEKGGSGGWWRRNGRP